jgi:hypothetical protein
MVDTASDIPTIEVGKLPGERELELEPFPSQRSEGQRRQLLRVALPRQQRSEHAAPAAAARPLLQDTPHSVMIATS